jgi:hypothetical protein
MNVYLFGKRSAVFRRRQQRRIDKRHTIIVAELAAETAGLIGHFNNNIGILDRRKACRDKALVDFRLSQDAETFAGNLAGDDTYGAVAAGTLAAAGGIDLYTSLPRRIQQRRLRLYLESNPCWLKSYRRHGFRFSLALEMASLNELDFLRF